MTTERAMSDWNYAGNGLPPAIKDGSWIEYNVVVERSHYPTSTYDICDAPYSETLVTTARYDSAQKIWHLSWDEDLNALLDIEDAPLNGDYVTHWMPLPEPPKED